MKMPAKTAFPARAGMNRPTAKLFQEVKAFSARTGMNRIRLTAATSPGGVPRHARG